MADEHLRWSDNGDCWLFEVRGKNTKSGDPELRDTWMPCSVPAAVFFGLLNHL